MVCEEQIYYFLIWTWQFFSLSVVEGVGERNEEKTDIEFEGL